MFDSADLSKNYRDSVHLQIEKSIPWFQTQTSGLESNMAGAWQLFPTWQPGKKYPNKNSGKDDDIFYIDVVFS